MKRKHMLSLAQKVMTMPGLGGSVGNRPYLLRDEFTTAASAPLSSPRSCEPGPGMLAITDSLATLAIVAGELTPSASSTGVRDPWIREIVGRSRLIGRTLISRLKRTTMGLAGNSPLLGFGNTLTNPDAGTVFGLLASNPIGNASTQGFVNTPEVMADDTYYVGAIALRSAGHFIFINAALAWVEITGNDATLYPMLINRVAAGQRQPQIDYLRLADLGGSFATDYGIATLHQTVGLTSGANFTGDADGIHDLTYTGPGSPVLNDEVELQFNVTDSSNYNTAYMIRAAADWTFKMDTVLATVATNRISVTGIATLPTTIRVIGNGSLRDCYTLSGTTWTKRGFQSNVSNQNTSVNTNFTGDGTLGAFTPSALDSFPRTSSAYAVLSSI